MRYASGFSTVVPEGGASMGGWRALRRLALLTLVVAFAFMGGAPLAAHNSLLATHFLSKFAQDAEGSAISDATGQGVGQKSTKPIWHLRMHFAQATLDGAVATFHDADRLRSLTRTELEEILVRYVRDSVQITSDAGGTIQLTHPVAVVGGHESVFEFDVVGIPSETEKLRVRIAAGAENRNHTNMLYTIVNGHKKRFILDASNDYTVRARVGGLSIYVWALLVVVCMILSAVIAAIFWTRRAASSPG